MGIFSRLLQTGVKKGWERAAVLQVPVSQDQKDVLYPAIADCAELVGTTKTHVVLEALANALIEVPDNEGFYIENVYRDVSNRPQDDPYPKKIGVIRGIESYFRNLSDENFRELAYPMIKLLDDFAGELELRLHAPVEVDDPRVNLGKHYAPPLFALITEKGGIVTEAAQVASQREGEPLLRPLLQPLLDNWSICVEATNLTRKYLVYVSGACTNWEDCASDRARFADVCKQCYRERVALEAKRASEKAQEEIEATLVRYPLANGDYLMAPLAWIPVNSRQAAESSYVHAIAVKDDGNEINAPVFLHFANKPAVELTREEETELLEEADQQWDSGSLVDIRHQEREYDSAAEDRNAVYTELASIPRVGIFGIQDEGFWPKGDEPGGAYIHRANKTT